jgi:hypothetical protein
VKFSRYLALFSISSALALAGCQDDLGLGQLSVSGAFVPNAVDFGEVPVGMSKAIPVTLKNTGRPVLKVDNVKVPPDFALRGLKGLLEGRSLASGEEVDFELVFFPMAEGPREERIVVTSDDVEIVLTITAVGVIRQVPLLRLDPAVLDFGTVAVNATQQATVTVHNTGTADGVLGRATLQSTGADIQAGDVYLTGSLPVTIPVGASATIDVVFTPQDSIQYTDVMVFHTPDGSHEPLELTLGGTGLAPAGDIVCTPSMVAFGQVERGTVATQTIRCEPIGGTVRLIGAGIDNRMFALATPLSSGDLSPGAQLPLDVEFRPEGLPGGQVGALTIEYNGGSGIARTIVTLTGEVIPPPPDVTALTAILSWSTNQHDVDIHLVKAGANSFTQDDCYYANLSPDWGTPGDQTDNPFLDIDDLDGYGPETINLSRSAPASYEVWVHFYSSDFQGRPTNATVEIHIAGSLEGTYTRNMLTCNQMWHVGTVNWDGSNGTFTQGTRIEMSTRGACF